MSRLVRVPQARSLATQARLLEATIACVAEHGYAGASTPLICKRAKVSRGAQLHHYPTKAELVAAAVERVFEKRHDEFRRELARLPASGGARLDAAVDALWAIYSGKTLAAWMELVVAARTDEPLRERVAAVEARFFAEAQATFLALFGELGVPQAGAAAATRIVLSCFDGLALHHVVQPGDPSMPEVLATLKGLLGAWVR
jgi:AcrR family transcriptional regulator